MRVKWVKNIRNAVRSDEVNRASPQHRPDGYALAVLRKLARVAAIEAGASKERAEEVVNSLLPLERL